MLSRRSAAALWEVAGDSSRAVDVSVRARAGRSRGGIQVHCGDRLEEADIATRDGIPCTTLARTLLDLATTADRRSLERSVRRAEELRRFDLAEVTALLKRSDGAPGTGRLAAALAEYDAAAFTRNEAEERFLALVRAAGLPSPGVNVWIPLPAAAAATRLTSSGPTGG